MREDIDNRDLYKDLKVLSESYVGEMKNDAYIACFADCIYSIGLQKMIYALIEGFDLALQNRKFKKLTEEDKSLYDQLNSFKDRIDKERCHIERAIVAEVLTFSSFKEIFGTILKGYEYFLLN